MSRHRTHLITKTTKGEQRHMAVQEKIKDPFIYVEDNVLPADVCEEIIRRFEKNKHEHKQGAIGKGIDTSMDSLQLPSHGTCDTKKGALESKISTKVTRDRTPNAARVYTSI